jgi:hypothetical protein
MEYNLVFFFLQFRKPIFKGDEPEKRGLAVVCSHSIFIHTSHNLKNRDSAIKDRDMMKSLWDLYGCHVIDFTDKGNNFYDTELIEKSKFYRWLVVCLFDGISLHFQQ